jgi:DNA-binding MarR family transcriptional regulator
MTTPPRWLTPLEHDAWLALLAGTRRIFLEIESQLAEHELNFAEYEVLARLSLVSDHRMRMSELADEVVFSRSRLSHLVGRLESRGLVSRECCPSDARGQLCSLTDPGVALLKQVAPGHVAVVRSVLFDRTTPEHVEMLRDVFTAISARD